ncbi:hypothetical protein HEK616_36520 [Streptomyces nigrescens]|uniref:Uncharacterized protein n=1 Tax=Streptomyces nigrescens TaxID=1920 RepID=A0ABN6QVS6_STRNI|nr:hypothetical protein HEK616_36520 [Streptomyces nigrescens]
MGESEALPRDDFEVVNSALSDNCQLAEELRCTKCGVITTQADTRGGDGHWPASTSRPTVTGAHLGSANADDSADSTLDEIQDCTCVEFCDEDPKTACGLSGRRHVHPASQGAGFGPCPAHPDAPGDL